MICLTFRRNFLYMLRRDPRQLQQVFQPRDRPALRLFYERILRPNVRPRRRQLPPHSLVGLVIDPPFSPRPSVVDHLKALITPRMKRVRDRNKAFCFGFCMRCSSSCT